MIQRSYDDKPILYLVPTPIGNFDDITIRSLEILKSVEVVFCEDTRITSNLLKHFNINKKLISCHEHNEKSKVLVALSYLEKGYNIAYCSDQGSPLISDPGFILSKEIVKHGYNLVSLPGTTSFVPALSNSLLDPMPFLFYGFLNSNNNKQLKELELLKNVKYTMIFFESGKRIINTLKNIYMEFGDRNISISREISKIYEEVIRDSISNLIKNENSLILKGEFVLVVSGNDQFKNYSDNDIILLVDDYINSGYKQMDAIKKIAKDIELKKSYVYSLYVNNKNEGKK